MNNYKKYVLISFFKILKHEIMWNNVKQKPSVGGGES